MNESSLPEQEKLTDESDRASRAEQEALDEARRNVARRMTRAQEPDAKGVYAVTECDLCGEEIGEERLKVAIKNLWCIYCARAEERRR